MSLQISIQSPVPKETPRLSPLAPTHRRQLFVGPKQLTKEMNRESRRSREGSPRRPCKSRSRSRSHERSTDTKADQKDFADMLRHYEPDLLRNNEELLEENKCNVCHNTRINLVYYSSQCNKHSVRSRHRHLFFVFGFSPVATCCRFVSTV